MEVCPEQEVRVAFLMEQAEVAVVEVVELVVVAVVVAEVAEPSGIVDQPGGFPSQVQLRP